MKPRPIVALHYAPVWLHQTETWLYQQVRHLPPEIETHIVCERTQNLDQFALPHIHNLENEPYWRYVWDRGLRRLRIRRHLGFLVAHSRRAGAHIIHSHFGHVGWSNLGAAKGARTRHVVTFYGYDISLLPRIDPRWYRRYWQLFARVDCVLCEGPHMAQGIITLGCPQEKVRVHHLGVPVDKIAFRPRKWKRDEPLRVLVAASFREKKGIPCALEALGRLQHEVPLKITIIGDASQEPRSQREKQKILRVIQEHNLGAKVSMQGYQPYSVLLEEAYRCHVFLAPSVTAYDGDTEGGAPVIIIEMMATGTPIVSTHHCDIPEIVQHGRTGLLAEERDVDGLVEHLTWLVRHPERWGEMVAAGRQHVEKEYNAMIQGERLGKIYREVADTV